MEKQAIRRIPVESSMIRSVGHSFPRRTMEIEFKDGSVYRYQGVKKSDFKSLLLADSKGKHFHQEIKKKFPYKKYQDKDGERVKETYHMKESAVRSYEAFCKIAAFNEYQAPTSVSPKRWEPAPPLSKAEKATMTALLATGTTLGLISAAHRIAEKRSLAKKKKELQEAGWIDKK